VLTCASYCAAQDALIPLKAVSKGPMYRWAKTVDPYDYGYPNEFLQAFSRLVSFAQFRKYEAVTKKGAGDFVMDVDVTFVAR
jgi:hypothetical protein